MYHIMLAWAWLLQTFDPLASDYYVQYKRGEPWSIVIHIDGEAKELWHSSYREF